MGSDLVRSRGLGDVYKRQEILRTSELIKAAYISAGALDLTLEADIITGSSAMELSSKLNASANVSGGGWGFKGEAGASFNLSLIHI